MYCLAVKIVFFVHVKQYEEPISVLVTHFHWLTHFRRLYLPLYLIPFLHTNPLLLFSFLL